MVVRKDLDHTANLGAAAASLLQLQHGDAHLLGLYLLEKALESAPSDFAAYREKRIAEARARKAAAAPQEDPVARWKRETAPRIWTMWHLRTLVVDRHRGTAEDEAEWLRKELLPLIICGECKTETSRFVEKLITYRPWSRGDYFDSVAVFHNSVNERLGRLAWPVDRAREHWIRIAADADDRIPGL